MGKPRMIILVRHAQSEGNKNRDIHQFIPDHRVKLTQLGWSQAEEAGRQLRSLLKPDDTIQFFTSPYRRTRETTEGILRTLTSDEPSPSPFPRNKITVFEEPRLREQDFGNFQPCSAEMERMWQERADYGHFFYRIPNGESAADAYDRVSGFNESMWRQFSEPDFPSVCVLVTHGLMTRVFLMKWYHWSVEYFEDLRNVNHCEFIVMKQSPANSKYILENELRTWSALKKRAAADGKSNGTATSSRPTSLLGQSGNTISSPVVPIRRWGGCANGCNHDKMSWPKRVMRKNTADFLGNQAPAVPLTPMDEEKDDNPIASQEGDHAPAIKEPTPQKPARKSSTKAATGPPLPLTPASPNDASDDGGSSDGQILSSEAEDSGPAPPRKHQQHHAAPRTGAILRHLQPPSAGEGFSDDSDYFPGMQHLHVQQSAARRAQREKSKERKARKQTQKGWMEESGMYSGARADTLGDGDELSDVGSAPYVKIVSPTHMEGGENMPILKEALKGDMAVEKGPEAQSRAQDNEEVAELSSEKKISEEDIEQMKERDRKSLSEVY
ncbi:phosphoglycerate mutase-like protein [Bimuria novae-zelandiae CBS 107.79]|uniref:Phosphoglycerate mutase-like protein n=1 Tax=Bimuria novae-zelandiae CBS 107.79 TaxID=1447943 RepID=A0A6A5VCJ3_9PLEO|nr:phosphoglycerate mutase-like protein [Bimuria novae-zelandiae CBS 107.79]